MLGKWIVRIGGDATVLWSCPLADFDIRVVEPSCFITVELLLIDHTVLLLPLLSLEQ
jgi:hypothetical protein